MQHDDHRGSASPGVTSPASDVGQDQFVLIRIEGMHCHKCEKAISNALQKHDGVHEVEVDFASGQASVLFDRNRVNVMRLMESVKEAGYKAIGFSQSHADSASVS